MGDPERRAILMEAVAAVCYLMAGSDVVILRHPETVRITRAFIDLMINGGMASDVQEISKRLEAKEADLVSISPEPNLDFAEPEAAPKPKVAKPEKKEAAPKPEKKEEKPAPPPKEEEKVVEVKPKAEDEADVKARAEADAKARAEADAKARAEADATAKVEQKAKETESIQALRYQRALEREKHEAEMRAAEAEEISKTAAKEQLSQVEKLMQKLDRIHKRV